MSTVEQLTGGVGASLGGAKKSMVVPMRSQKLASVMGYGLS